MASFVQDQLVTGCGGAVGRYGPQRIARRSVAILPVIVRESGREHVGVLRDISAAGMFFYSSLTPAVGSEIEVVIKASDFDPRVTACCRCTVMRVETHRGGAATGIGVAISSYESLDAAEAFAEPAASYPAC
jgi:hypothetical protein